MNPPQFSHAARAACPCDFCGALVPFAVESFQEGQTAKCAACGNETVLALPADRPGVSRTLRLGEVAKTKRKAGGMAWLVGLGFALGVVCVVFVSVLWGAVIILLAGMLQAIDRRS